MNIAINPHGIAAIYRFEMARTLRTLAESIVAPVLTTSLYFIVFGAAITLITKERAGTMIRGLEALNEIVLKIVDMAMKLAPYGVAGLVFGVTSRFGLTLLIPLSVYVTVVIAALLIHAVVNYSWILRFIANTSPLQFFGRIRAPIVTAFSTSSFTAEAGRSTTSPAAIWSARTGSRRRTAARGGGARAFTGRENPRGPGLRPRRRTRAAGSTHGPARRASRARQR